MEKGFKKLSNKVIVSDIGMYYTKADGASSFRNIISDELNVHILCAYDTEIETEDLSLVKAIVVGFIKESDRKNIEIIICDSLGTFISDWY